MFAGDNILDILKSRTIIEKTLLSKLDSSKGTDGLTLADVFIDKNNLRNNIRFLGPLDEVSFAKELSESSLFLLPSLIENSPNSLIEAQICGVPSIVSYAGGTPYMLPSDYEYFFNSQDSCMLASMILQLLKDPARAKFVSEYLVSYQNNIQSGLDNCDSLINYYKSIINQSNY